MYSQTEGRRLTDLGIEESAIEWALASALPVVEEVERRPDVTVLLHCIPLLADDVVTGCLVLLRDVTDVRRLDRLLLSKDAAIREVHHRVKNNLQTISALLRLQARRLPPGRGQGRPVRGGAPGPLHRHRPRDPVPRAERPGSLRRDRDLADPDGRGLGGPRPRPHLRGDRRAGRGAGRRGHAAGRGAGRAAAERRGARLPRRRSGRPAARVRWARRIGCRGDVAGARHSRRATSGCTWSTTSAASRSRSSTTGRVSPRGSTSTPPRAWAVDRPGPGPEPAGRNHHHAQPQRRRPGVRGTVVVIELPVQDGEVAGL